MAVDSFLGVYDRGYAVGESNIKTDTMRFRFRDETFEFPASAVIPDIATYNGYFYEARVEDLRRLRAKRK
jgi:hypothetical protein